MKNLILTFCLICGTGMINLSCDKGLEQFGGNQKKEEAAETGRRWYRVDTANETVEGVQLIFKFDVVTDSFIGTLENLNGHKVTKVRVQVHVFDRDDKSAEYGPTAPEDLAPGEKIEVALPTPGFDAFITFSVHPKMG